jgi:hypothetical protein
LHLQRSRGAADRLYSNWLMLIPLLSIMHIFITKKKSAAPIIHAPSEHNKSCIWDTSGLTLQMS